MSMRLAIDFTHLRPGASLTGIQRVTMEYYHALRRMVECVPVREDRGAACALAAASLRGIEQEYKKGGSGRRLGGWWRRRYSVERVAGELEAILLPDLFEGSWPLKSARVAAALLHDMTPIKFPQWYGRGTLGHFPRYITELSRLSCLFVPSQATMEDLSSYAQWAGISLPPIHFLPHGVVEDVGALKNAAISAEMPKQLLALGTIEARKNYDALLSAVEKLWQAGERFELVVVGALAASGRCTAERIEQLRARGYPLVWHRGLADLELLKIMRRAWALVYVSHYEGYGLPVAEALAMGLPVVAGRGGALAERAAMGGVRSLESVDALAIANGIAALLKDNCRERLHMEALGVELPSWQSTAAQMLDILSYYVREASPR
jgi:glycosyltransferase involved in cell wall biosynthesis